MGKFGSFEELGCWQEARKLRNYVKDNLIPKLPVEERYSLISQIRRSSRSVGNNISEEHGRFHYQENIQFCRMAKGSLNETLDHGIIALDEDYIDESAFNELRTIHYKTLLILNGYIKYLKRQKEK